MAASLARNHNMSKISLSMAFVLMFALGCGDMASPADLGAFIDSGAVDAWERYCTVDGPARATACGARTPRDVASCRTDAACIIRSVHPNIATGIPMP